MDFENLFTSFYSEENTKKGSYFFIQHYEKNESLIKSENNFIDETFKLKADYSTHLVFKENYSKAIPILNECIDNLVTSLSHFNKINIEEYLDELTFMKAKCFYYTDSVQKSAILLKELHLKHPDNNIYQNWYLSALKYRYNKIIKILWSIVTTLFVISFVFDYFDLNKYEDVSITVAVFSLTIVGLLNLLNYVKVKRNS